MRIRLCGLRALCMSFLLRALRELRVRIRLRDLCVLCVSFLLRVLRGLRVRFWLCALCVGFGRGGRWSGPDGARGKAEAFPEGVDDLVLFVETDDER